MQIDKWSAVNGKGTAKCTLEVGRFNMKDQKSTLTKDCGHSGQLEKEPITEMDTRQLAQV